MASFEFKQFVVENGEDTMPLTTDAVLLGAWAKHPQASPQSIWDIGTGTGIVALMLAQRFPQARILATDIAPSALKQAQKNIAASPFVNQIDLLEHDIQTPLPTSYANRRFRLVVANPPYFAHTAYRSLGQNRARSCRIGFEPGGLFTWLIPYLSADGVLALVTPVGTLPQLRLAACQHLWQPLHICEVAAFEGGTPSLLLSLWGRHGRVGIPPVLEKLFIRQRNGRYSPCFISLTEDFYCRLPQLKRG